MRVNNNKFRTNFVAIALVAICCLSFSALAHAEVRGGADDRIKTMVYNSEEVYTILTKVGFNTTIELSRKEKIQTLSLGESVGWQVTPATNRVFIKPLLRNGTTNLSIITDKRTYQFELIVSSSAVRNASHAYVVKFYYPSENNKPKQSYEVPSAAPFSPPSAPAAFPTTAPFVAPEPPALAPVSAVPSVPSGASEISGLPSLGSIGIQAYNFNYTLTGPEQKAPRKIFDDGKSTYFEFDTPMSSSPKIYAIAANGEQNPLNVRQEGKKYIVNTVAPKFVIRDVNDKTGQEQICIFNEAMFGNS